MSDRFNEESSEAQRRAEKIKAIRRSIHGEAEVAPTTYDNKTAESEMLSYCSLCLKKGDYKNFLYLISKLYEMKEKEDEEIKSLPGSNTDSKKTQLKHLKNLLNS